MTETEALLCSIIEQSPMSMAIVAMDGTIEYINPKAIETFGYTYVDIPTMDKWWAVAYPDKGYRDEVIARWTGYMREALAEQREIRGDEYQVTCKDGTVKTMLIRGAPVAGRIFVMFNDISSFKKLQGDLEKGRDELERKVKDRTAKLQALAEEIIRVEHRERRRIAHVLHEDLQQWLAAAKFRLGELRDHGLAPAAGVAADRVQHMLDKAIEVTRSLAMDLRPPIIHEQGLRAALRWLAADMKHKFSMTVIVRAEAISDRVAEEMGIFVFEAVRELLMNVVKHAEARNAVVRVMPQGRGRFRVEVTDRGKGFDPGRNGARKFGLFSIRERADVLGGSMEIASKPGRGTSVMLTLPLKSRLEAPAQG